MKREGFLSTSRHLAAEYLKVDAGVVDAIIEKLLRVDEESTGEFLRIGENYFITPKGLNILASNMAVPGNIFQGVDPFLMERLWDDLYEMGVIEPRLYFLMKRIKLRD